MITKAEEKRSWFASFREWMDIVATFLDEKVCLFSNQRASHIVLMRHKFPLVEKLEDEQISLLQERYDMIDRRRRADENDDLSLFLGILPLTVPYTDDNDEMGGVIPEVDAAAARRDRMSARLSRRAGRRARSRTVAYTEEGYSTDSSLPPSDATDYATATEKLLERGKDILFDVKAKDFREPKLGLGKWFGEWRERYSDNYTGAWGGLGMVGAWEFWTRLEMLGWNPVEARLFSVCSLRGPNYHLRRMHAPWIRSRGTHLCTTIHGRVLLSKTSKTKIWCRSWGPMVIWCLP